MAISEAAYDSEAELQKWAFQNCKTFFGDCLLLSSFRITTPSGKHGIPDGFVFNFVKRSWWIVECELLAHGVWPHIAEQITRFVVAARNPMTLRQIRDKLFEKILEDNRHAEIAAALKIEPTRLLQQIELFIEGVSPSLAIFIDDTAQDLVDFCDALDLPTEIYRVKKFIVNGAPEFYSPDKNLPAIVFEPEAQRQQGSVVFDVVEELGGGEVVSSRNNCFRLKDGKVIKVQYSKFYDRHNVYWYGINPNSLEKAIGFGCTDFVFIMGDEGFVMLPLSTLSKYTETAYTTENQDGTIRHYHVHITRPPDVVLKGYGNAPDMDIKEYFQTFD